MVKPVVIVLVAAFGLCAWAYSFYKEKKKAKAKCSPNGSKRTVKKKYKDMQFTPADKCCGTFRLRCTDGAIIDASKLMLAENSPFFNRELVATYKDFQDEFSSSSNSSTEISMPYSGKVLQMVIFFCHGVGINQMLEIIDESSARTLVQLFDCTEYLEMDRFGDEILDVVAELKESSLIFAIRDEAERFSRARDLKNLAKYHLSVFL